MPKCYDCGKEQPILRSETRLEIKHGVALCDECFDKSKKNAEGKKKNG
ncbi:Hypothetical protein LUCI_0806 [Lucifera butyrica]|uniref:Uncharacterized protein n=1 Tax=Lucifera butyrica TaxID=1351585 RepID=A0A498QZH4_9FIRM|nr:Hypothetical protein LUCI_0806 [Lucifera butyrica]